MSLYGIYRRTNHRSGFECLRFQWLRIAKWASHTLNRWDGLLIEYHRPYDRVARRLWVRVIHQGPLCWQQLWCWQADCWLEVLTKTRSSQSHQLGVYTCERRARMHEHLSRRAWSHVIFIMYSFKCDFFDCELWKLAIHNQKNLAIKIRCTVCCVHGV